jgi:hypothetical protein
MKKIISLILVIAILGAMLVGCGDLSSTATTTTDTQKQIKVSRNLEQNQPTPTDVDYSLERYNLIRRAYWVNGQREKARALPCQIADVPFGYIVLFTESGSVIGKFIVEGKVSSLNSFLTPESEYYEQAFGTDGYSKNGANKWLADVDGSYGENDNGIFFFTPDGKYIEWTGIYLYSDIPFEVKDPIVKVGK